MAQVLQLRRGTTAQNDAFIGAVAEVSVDTDRKSLRVHDGSTMGGKEIADLQTAVPLLPAASSVSGSDTVPVIQSGVARKATKTQILNGIVDANIATDAAIALSKLATGALPTGITVADANVANISGTKLADSSSTTTGVTNSKLRQSAALSVIGRSANTTGAPDDIVAANDGEVLQRSGTVIGFGQIATAGLANGAVTPAKLSQPYTLATSVASTSGTAIDFTGIPSWAKRITVMFNGVSTNGTSNPLIQLGTSAGVTTTGYASAASSTTYTTGFGISAASASNVLSGQALISLVSGNIWTAILIISNTAAGGGTVSASGVITLAATLDRIRITTVNGTDTFDAGTINIAYEG